MNKLAEKLILEAYSVAYQTARTGMLLLAELDHAKMGKKHLFSFNQSGNPPQ